MFMLVIICFRRKQRIKETDKESVKNDVFILRANYFEMSLRTNLVLSVIDEKRGATGIS